MPLTVRSGHGQHYGGSCTYELLQVSRFGVALRPWQARLFGSRASACAQ